MSASCPLGCGKREDFIILTNALDCLIFFVKVYSGILVAPWWLPPVGQTLDLTWLQTCLLLDLDTVKLILGFVVFCRLEHLLTFFLFLLLGDPFSIKVLYSHSELT